MSINTTTDFPHSPITPVSSFPNTTTHADLTEHHNFGKRLTLSLVILLPFIIVWTILGNSLVLVATWRERSLHQPNKYFIACLAVADLLVGCFVATAWLHKTIVWYEFYDNSLEVIPQLNIYLCRFSVWMDAVSFGASVCTMTFISFDRYLKITKPLYCKLRMTTSRSLKIIFTIWLITSCFATYAATPSSGSNGLFSGSYIGKSLRDLANRERFYTFFSIIGGFLPTVIILIMYALIFVAAHKRRKMFRNGELGQTNNDENQRATFLKDLKVIMMLLVVVGVFMTCWCPLVITVFLEANSSSFYNDLSYKSSVSLDTIVRSLPLLNSVCNPIIYACLDQTYKRAFKHLFQRMMCRPSSTTPTVQLRPIRTRQQNV